MSSKNFSVLLIAHGSRVASANDEVRYLGKQLQEKLQRPVIACFLELASPDIPAGINLALQTQSEQILILPYFLTGGRHVREDIPQIVEQAMQKQSTPYRILSYVGAHPEMPQFLSKILAD